MAKVEQPLPEPPEDSSLKESLDAYLEDIRRKANSQGDAVADISALITKTPDLTYGVNELALFVELIAISLSLKAQLNDLLVELRSAGYIARS